MKHFKNINIADVLVLLVPLTLIMPNIIMAAYDVFPTLEKFAMIALPSGAYLLLMSVWRKSYFSTLIAVPLMVLAAFQIVIVSLYDSPAPIGIDMFLNVLSSNTNEIAELLSGLLASLTFVALLYLSDIVLAIIGIRKRQDASLRIRRISGISGALLFLLGIAGAWCSHLSLKNNLFPVNAAVDLYESVVRYQRINSYPDSSKDFSYRVVPGKEGNKEVYIAVIGETSRADNWSILGYDRNTNPLLSAKRDSLFAFSRVFSESNTTHKAVPMLLTTLTATNFEDSIYTHKSVISAFKDAGFYTAFVSNQERNGSFIEYYEREADSFIPLDNKNDRYVLPVIDSLLSTNEHDKLLLVVHLYGSHYNYSDRYEKGHGPFMPDHTGPRGNSADRETIINAYDNTIVNTDYTLNEIIEMLQGSEAQGGLIYSSDHGEDIFDGGRNRFLHASPFTSYWQLHVPMCVYVNDAYRTKYPEKVANLKSHEESMISSSRSYSHSLLDMAGIATPYLDMKSSLLSSSYSPPLRLVYLNDRNEPVSLKEAGFDSVDETQMNRLGCFSTL